MTMTVGAIRNVSFGDSAQDLINSEGKYSAQAPIADMPADSFEKKSNKGAIAAGIAGAGLLAAAAGLGYAVSKGHIKLDKIRVAEEELGKIDSSFGKAWAHVKNFAATCLEKLQGGYETVAGWFTKSGEKVAANAEEAAEGAAAAEKA